MYKRQYYAVDHAGKEDASSSDSSSLDTDSDGSGEEQDDAAWPASDHESGSSGEEGVAKGGDSDADSDNEKPGDSESEDEEWSAFRASRAKEVQTLDSSHFLSSQWADAVDDTEKERMEEAIGDSMVLRVGGILKCRLCVKTMCLSEDTMRAHLVSKGHARSLKQLANGKLKIQLDSDGEEDEEAETHTERIMRMRNLVEEKAEPVKRKRDSGRQRQQKRAKKKALLAAKETLPQATPEAAPTSAKSPKLAKSPKRPKSSIADNGADKKSPKAAKFSRLEALAGTLKASLKAPGVAKSPKAAAGGLLSKGAKSVADKKRPPVRRKDEVRKRKSL